MDRNYLAVMSKISTIMAVYVFSYWLWRAAILPPSTAANDLGSLLFIPHGVRVLSALLFGWLGVVGSFFGSLLAPYIILGTKDPTSLYDAGESFVGASSPMIALLILRWTGLSSHIFRPQQLLKQLNIKLLILIIFLSSGVNSFLVNLITAVNGETSFRSPMTILNFFIGDIAGALLVVSVSLIVILGFKRYKK